MGSMHELVLWRGSQVQEESKEPERAEEPEELGGSYTDQPETGDSYCDVGMAAQQEYGA